jgi:hypothetical protein
MTVLNMYADSHGVPGKFGRMMRMNRLTKFGVAVKNEAERRVEAVA